MNVSSRTKKITANLKKQANKASNFFKEAIANFENLVKAANERLKEISLEREKKMKEIGMLDTTKIQVEREKAKASIIQNRLMSLLEVDENEIDKVLGTVPDTVQTGPEN